MAALREVMHLVDADELVTQRLALRHGRDGGHPGGPQGLLLLVLQREERQDQPGLDVAQGGPQRLSHGRSPENQGPAGPGGELGQPVDQHAEFRPYGTLRTASSTMVDWPPRRVARRGVRGCSRRLGSLGTFSRVTSGIDCSRRPLST